MPHEAALLALGAEADSSLVADERPDTKNGIEGAVCLRLGTALERTGGFAPGAPQPKGLWALGVGVTSLSKRLERLRA